MRLTMLGTGEAEAIKCYNTCFILEEKGEYLLVDGGGGNQLFNQLIKAGVDWKDIKNIFVTHKHTDHLFGIIWLLRVICESLSRQVYEGDVNVYVHEELSGFW